MGFEVKIIAKVSFTNEGEPYTHYMFNAYHIDKGETIIPEYVFEIPKPPEELRPYMNMYGRHWGQFFPNTNEYMDIEYLLHNLPDWEDVEEKDDDWKEHFEAWKKLLEWCLEQDCEFMIIGW